MLQQPYPVASSYETKIHFLSFKHALIDAVRTAKTRIWVMCYVLNSNLNRQNDPVTHFLNILHKHQAAGADVRFIIDDPNINKPNYHCNKFFMRRLDDMGIPFVTPPDKITSHAKAVLIDNSVLFIGSHNLAKSSLENPLDCTVELRNKILIDSFAGAYHELWLDPAMETHQTGTIKKYAYYG